MRRSRQCEDFICSFIHGVSGKDRSALSRIESFHFSGVGAEHFDFESLQLTARFVISFCSGSSGEPLSQLLPRARGFRRGPPAAPLFLFLQVGGGGAKRSCSALTPRECHSRIHPSLIARLNFKPRAAFRSPSVRFSLDEATGTRSIFSNLYGKDQNILDSLGNY